MSVAGSVAIAVAERVEKTGGPRAGLVAWTTLAANASDGDTRGKALSAGLRCASALRDATAIAELLALWPTIDRGDWSAPVAALCRDLARAEMLPQATALAAAEAARYRTSLALYTYARCLDVARADGAAAAFRATIERAEAEGALRITDAARVRLVAILARSWTTAGGALAEAAKLDAPKLAWNDRIDLARVLLLSASRFVRAGAIGILADAARADDHAVRQRARRLAARYADEAGDGVTPLEHDRLVAVFDPGKGREAIKGSVAPALAPIVTRAGEILRGRVEILRDDVPVAPADPAARRVVRHGEILDVVTAMRDRSPARAARSLRPLVAALAGGERLPREALAVAHAALVDGDLELRAVALDLFRIWLQAPSYAAPPRGFLGLADALADAGQPDLATIARRAAALRKESGAVHQLGTILTRAAWEASLAHDRPHAIALLREAKALLSG